MRKSALILLALISLAFNACQKKQWKVRYTVTCQDCDVTYENESGGTAQFSPIKNSWVYDFTGADGKFVYVSSQNNLGSGNVTVTILLNGNVFKTSTSSGSYCIATADGTLRQ